MLPEDLPLVSLITLNYNQAEVTCAFLESCRALTYPRYEILVCDMASNQDPTALIEAGQYLHTRVLVSKENLGFAGGNNWAMRQTEADFVFIVNNDTEVTPHLIEDLLEPFYQDPTIGVVCPKIKFYFHPDTIQYAGFQPMHPYTGRVWEVGGKQKDEGQFDQPGFTHGAHGCAMMVSRSVIERVGMFPELFFLYYEEWDWSARILKAGFKIWYAGNATIYHKESMSVGKMNPMKVYYHTRNRILYMRRNSNPLQLIIFTLFFALFTVPKSTVQFLFAKQFEHLKNFYRGWTWNLFHSSYSRV